MQLVQMQRVTFVTSAAEVFIPHLTSWTEPASDGLVA